MDINGYIEQFTKNAVHKLDSEAINVCIKYATNLMNKGLPIIYDLKHLSYQTKYEASFLYLCINFKNKVYRQFKIKKRNGSDRNISEPLPNLKNIQTWIKTNILEKLSVHKVAKAFRKNQSIKNNAYFHKNQGTVLALDIKDFFNNINGKTVYLLFRRCGYSRRVSNILKELCTFNDCLPQGAPTSPIISNLIFAAIDNRIYKFTRKENLYYTRYADDITISGNDVKIKKVISFISMVLKENNFELNQDKIKVMRKNSCQLVTGIVSNNSVLNAPKYKIKDLRKEIYYIRKYGLDDHMTHVGIKKAHYIEHLMGVANFILFINKNNKTAKEALDFLRELQKQINYTF